MTLICSSRSLAALHAAFALMVALGPPDVAIARDEKVVAPGDVIDGWSIDLPNTAQLNINGQVAFKAESNQDGGHDVLLFGLPDVGFVEIAHTGVELLPRGGTLAHIGDIDLGERDDVAVRCGVDTGELTLANCALRANLAGVTELFRAGEPAPGGVAFGTSSLEMLRHGQLAFWSTFGMNGMSDGAGIFLTRLLDEPGVDAAVRDDQPHNQGGSFTSIGSLLEGHESSVLFSSYARFDGLNAQHYSLWSGSTSQPNFVMREGQELSATYRIESIESVSAAGSSTARVVAAGAVQSGSVTLNAISVGTTSAPPVIYNFEGDADPQYGEPYQSFIAIPQLETGPYIAFRATMANGTIGLFREGLAGRRSYPVARTGDRPPDENIADPYRYEVIGSSEAGGQQFIAFGATIRDPKKPQEGQLRGVYIAEPNEAKRITRAGLTIGGELVDDALFIEANGQGQVLYRVDYASGGSEQRLFTPDLHWRSAGSGNWSGFGNWTLSIHPDRVHDVSIDPATDLTVTAPAQLGGTRVRSLVLGGGAGVATLHFPGSGRLLETLASPLHVLPNGRITADNANLRGGLLNEGIVTIGSPADPGAFSMFDAAIENHGEFRGAGYLDAPSFANAANGSFVVPTGQMLASSIDAFSNTANAQVLVETGSQASFSGGFQNDANVDVAAGGTATFEGLVTGDGSFSGPGQKVFLGGIAPGSSAGRLEVQGPAVIGPDSIVVIEVFGAASGEYDVLAFENVTLQGGALELRFAGGYTPGAGDEFSFFDWGSRTGSFDRIALPELPSGRTWDTTALYQGGRIATVPEPGPVALGLVGWMALAALRIRLAPSSA